VVCPSSIAPCVRSLESFYTDLLEITVTKNRRQRRFSDKGTASVEMAIVLPVLLLFLAVPLFFARVFWFYSVSQKAAHDAARVLSTATQLEMKAQGSGFSEAPMAALARQIATEEMKEIIPALSGLIIDVQCDLSTCGIVVPQTVRVKVLIKIKDPFFSAITDELTGSDAFILASDVTMSYAGQ
jgi:hypothetical protein